MFVKRLPIPILALATLILLGLSACLRPSEASVKLDPNPILSGGPGWLVVKEAFARVKEKPAADSADLAHVRRGGSYQILAVEFGTGTQDSPPSTWYRISADGVSGWIAASDIDVTASREQAEYEASGMR